MTARKAPPRPTSRLPDWIGWASLILLAVLPYLRSIDYPLLHDDRTVLSSPWLAREADAVSVWSSDFFRGTRHEGAYLYRPVTSLSLAWNLRAAPSRSGIRGVNVALHALATLAAAWVLAALMRRGEAASWVGRRIPFAAWAGAALFAVHPLGSEAVLWAVGRAEILAALFGLVAFRLFLGGLDVPGAGGWRYPAALVVFFLALGSKESAAAWLLLGALAVAILRPTLPSGAPRRALVRGVGFGAVLALFLVLRGAAVGWGRPAIAFVDNPLAASDPATRVANAVLLLGRYSTKLLRPYPLSVEYGFDQIPVVPLAPWGGIAALALLALWAAVGVTLFRRSRVAAFLWAFFPGAFAVTGNALFPVGTILADRLAYLPILGACGLAGMGLGRLPGGPRARTAAAAATLLLLGARTWDRSGDYRDLLTLREATAAASPRAVKALVNAGRTRLRSGRPADAVAPLELATSIWPDYTRAWELLADAYAAVGRSDLAATAARHAHESGARGAVSDDERENGGVDSAAEGAPLPVR